MRDSNSSVPLPISLDECLVAYRQVVEKFGYAPVIQPGRIELLGWDLEYVCGPALANFIDQILVRRLNDFIPDNDQPLILDCGANIGFTVLNYKRQFPKARVVAFEPDPQFVPVLRWNLKHNDAGDVQVVEAAVWIRDGHAKWFSEGIDGSRIVDSEGGEANVVSVQTVDLTNYLAEDVDLLKLDIEGAEYQVVAHLGKHLRKVKNILVECHLSQTTVVPFSKMLEVLTAAGFRVSVNSFGAWRDLIRQTQISPNHWEQYLLVAGWRGSIPLASPEESTLPYTGIQSEIALHTTRAEAQDLRNALASVQSDLQSRQAALTKCEAELSAWESELVMRGRDLATRENQLLQSLRSYFVIGKALESRVLSAPIAHEGDHGWVVTLADLEAGADDEQNPTRSALIMFENENLLGPAHSAHNDIRNMGSGRYSHWGTNLYFSTSDNSDPSTNGRTYTIVFVNAAPQSTLDVRKRELDEREREVAARQSAADARERELVLHEQEVTTLQKALEVRERALAAREAQVAVREHQVSMRQVAYDSQFFVRLGHAWQQLFRKRR